MQEIVVNTASHDRASIISPPATTSAYIFLVSSVRIERASEHAGAVTLRSPADTVKHRIPALLTPSSKRAPKTPFVPSPSVYRPYKALFASEVCCLRANYAGWSLAIILRILRLAPI